MRPIIVEGPDGSGKSTLAKKLSLDFGLPIHHPGGPPINRDEFLGRVNFYTQNKDKYIFDRCPHISELVYPKATGRLGVLSPSILYSQLEAMDPLVIYCRRRRIRDMWESIDLNYKPHKPKEHLVDVLKQFKDIVEGYDQIFRTLRKSHYLTYDWDEIPYTNLLEEIRKCAA